tara:strand:- start:1559 stop:2737 length:1179 start_codon:yes stop_codon:yes gene_type:complete
MSEKKDLNKQNIYNKHNSFFSFSSINKEFNEDKITKKINTLYKSKIGLNKINANDHSILDTAVQDLNLNYEQKKKSNFVLSKNVIDEILSLNENEILRYLVFRYKYEIFPLIKKLDKYPPYLQIEPSSICNYRCVFCFETDKTFTNKKNGFMGKMDKNLFKNIIDQIHGNIEFISLASRGEPLANPDIPEMLEYCSNKFLNLKINTNASLLDEKKIHAILAGGVKTLVFSADAADEKLYSDLRVNGNLKKVLNNIEKFQNIREKKYSKNPIITRVSGVKFNDKQNFDEMIKLWSGLVDQVAFVDYNPWENSYQKASNDIQEPCSDLWRRMFIWWDGKINPCDVDYKSLLSVGNIKDNNISNLWLSKQYNGYREDHLKSNRRKIKPCNSCTVV